MGKAFEMLLESVGRLGRFGHQCGALLDAAGKGARAVELGHGAAAGASYYRVEYSKIRRRWEAEHGAIEGRMVPGLRKGSPGAWRWRLH